MTGRNIFAEKRRHAFLLRHVSIDYFTAMSASLAFLFVPKLLQAAFSKAYIVYMPVFFWP